MATIFKERDVWRVQIRQAGKSTSKTFRSKAAAERWLKDQEKPQAITVGKMIELYRKMRLDSGREILDTSNEHYTLKRLAEAFGLIPADKLDTMTLVEFAQERRAEGASPYTVNMDISKLGTVIRHTKSLFNLTVGDPVGDARPALHHYKLIGGGGKRERRPSEDELEAMFQWFRTHPGYKTPMEDIIKVCILCAFRRSEVLDIRWADLNESRRTVLVRNRKDPRQKEGNDQEIPVLGEAWEIIQRQPRKDERIFPYTRDSVSKTFTTCCRALSIPDLHFHDCRHEAASQLAEAGWTIPEIAAVTGHKDWKHLRRYVQIDPVSLHEKKR
ncbi:MAG: Tyrosine recombinase XerC [Betaproteobacteria bacterium ADurb.Bin341]|nr:MAG: Tyrosine recombinase XerC [Betaproteobacteria bacterium ADurb.Bin341]